jgi:hypothetical protein
MEISYEHDSDAEEVKKTNLFEYGCQQNRSHGPPPTDPHPSRSKGSDSRGPAQMVGRLEGKERCLSFALSFEEKPPRPRLLNWTGWSWL